MTNTSQLTFEHDDRFWTFFDAAPLGMMIVDRENAVIESNEAMQTFLGYSADELKEIDFAELTDAKTYRQFEHQFKEMVEGKLRTFEMQTRYFHRDGHVVWGNPVRIGVLDTDNVLSHVVVMVVDITERKKLEEQLFRAEKLRAVGQLAGGVAHDFNNVLTIIDSYCQLASDSAPADDPIQEHLAKIRAAAERGTSITGQLANFSHQGLGEIKATNLNHAVEEVETLLRRLLRRSIELEITLADDVPAVQAEETQLVQVIMNLLLNAQDAMPDGGKLSVETSTLRCVGPPPRRMPDLRPGVYAVLTVRDTGHGMDAETVSQIFQPFFTTKGTKGTGLGLSTIYGLVQQGEGYVKVESEPDEGTTFHIYLSVASDEAEVGAPLLSPSTRSR